MTHIAFSALDARSLSTSTSDVSTLPLSQKKRVRRQPYDVVSEPQQPDSGSSRPGGHQRSLRSGLVILLLATLLVSSTLVQEVRVLIAERATASSSHIMTLSERPAIAWLASFPNSGTSYTMTLVERASNLSTATNYGAEITVPGDASLPVHADHEEGPYWEGLSGKRGTIRHLPNTYVMTKTHCGGRCIYCGPDEYIVPSTADFVQACAKTSALSPQGKRTESTMDPSRVARVIHLIRNPFHNVVARFHLERRHLVQKRASLDNYYVNNVTGFARWCHEVDKIHAESEERILKPKVLSMMHSIPCRGEFLKYAQWHEYVLDMMPLLGDGDGSVPSLTVHYEDYYYKFNETYTKLLRFVEQDVVGVLRPFRELPTYEDHYTLVQQRAIKTFLQAVSTPRVWLLIEHYFDGL